MKIYNETKTKVLNESEIDYEKGYLKYDKLFIAHHEAVAGKSAEEIAQALIAQGEICNLRFDGNWYRQTKVYESGGTEEERIMPLEPKEAYDEYEDIQIYVPYTEEELKERVECTELVNLEKWFSKVYDIQVKQYTRCQRLGIEYDNKYGTIAELDEKATINAKRISELRKKYSIQ